MPATDPQLDGDSRSWFQDHRDEIEPVVTWHSRQLSESHPAFQQEREDVANELWLEMAAKLALFDPRKSKAATFARVICSRKVVSMIRFCEAQCRRWDITQSLDQPLGGGEESFSATFCEGSQRGHRAVVSRNLLEEWQLADDLAELRKQLPRPLLELADSLMVNEPDAAATALNLSPAQFSAQLTQLRERCERVGLGKYL